jgi:threonine dehydrogenase-like Zn-dependent dehydrogenase
MLPTGRRPTPRAIVRPGRSLMFAPLAEILEETLPAMRKLKAYAGGDGPDVVIEAVWVTETSRAAVAEVAFAGRVGYIGYAKGPVT